MAENKVTKTEAVRRAMRELGKDASRTDIQHFVKEKFGHDMSPDHISNVKSEIAKQAKRGSAKTPAPKQAAPAKPAVAQKAAQTANGKVAVLLDDVLVVQALVKRLGGAHLRTLIAAFEQ